MREKPSAFQRTDGMIPAIIGSIFAVLGIFSLGFLFVPIAAICTFFALLSSLTRFSVGGFALTLLSAFLTLAGFVASPVLWVAVGGLVGR